MKRKRVEGRKVREFERGLQLLEREDMVQEAWHSNMRQIKQLRRVSDAHSRFDAYADQ